MTQSARNYPQPPPDDQGGWFSDPKYGRGGFLYLNIIVCLGVIFFSMFAINWFMSDISGVYSLNVAGHVMRVSIVRKPASIWGEMDLGNSAMLSLVTTVPPQDENVSWIFQTDEQWVKQGQAKRQVMFLGTIKDGVMQGQFQSGKKVFKAKLKRDGLDSLYRQVQAHMP